VHDIKRAVVCVRAVRDSDGLERKQVLVDVARQVRVGRVHILAHSFLHTQRAINLSVPKLQTNDSVRGLTSILDGGREIKQ
jgi:hypothetical protein